MRSLPILWKRLVKEGATCPRCGSTHANVVSAVKKLEVALQPLGIEPVLETLAIDETSFQADPSESNRIWIAGKPLEEWLGARVGASQCCTVCGDRSCRTMEIGDSTHETIPEDLIVRAAMMAASGMIGADSTSSNPPACSSTACACR
jgi:hypothetical protein